MRNYAKQKIFCVRWYALCLWNGVRYCQYVSLWILYIWYAISRIWWIQMIMQCVLIRIFRWIELRAFQSIAIYTMFWYCLRNLMLFWFIVYLNISKKLERSLALMFCFVLIFISLFCLYSFPLFLLKLYNMQTFAY